MALCQVPDNLYIHIYGVDNQSLEVARIFETFSSEKKKEKKGINSHLYYIENEILIEIVRAQVPPGASLGVNT